MMSKVTINRASVLALCSFAMAKRLELSLRYVERFTVIGLLATALSLASCGEKPSSSSSTNTSYTLLESVDECSPFVDLVGKRLLDFDASDKSVEFDEMISSTVTEDEDVLSSHHLRKFHGTFVVDEHARTVTVRVAGKATTYQEVEPEAGSDCILVYGTRDSADLNRSWFGDFPSEPPDSHADND